MAAREIAGAGSRTGEERQSQDGDRGLFGTEQVELCKEVTLIHLVGRITVPQVGR